MSRLGQLCRMPAYMFLVQPSQISPRVVYMRQSNRMRMNTRWYGRLRATMEELELTTVAGESAIIAWILGDSSATLAAASCMNVEGILAPAVRPPTVPNGKSRLRMSVSSDHSDDDMDRVTAALRKAATSHRQLAEG